MGWGMQRDGERGMQRGGDGEWTPRGRSVARWGVLGGCSGVTAPGLALAGRGFICPRSCEGARPERLSRTSRGDSRDHADGTAPLSHGSPAAPGRWERARVGPPRIWGACGRGCSWPGCAGTGAPQGCPFPGLGPRSSPGGSSPAPAPSPPSVLVPVPSQCPHPAMPLPVPRPSAEPRSPSPSQSPTPGPSPAPRLSPCIPAAFASACWAQPRPPRQYTPAPSPGPPGHPPVPSPLRGRSLPSAARCLPRCPPQWLRCIPRAPAQHPRGIPQPHPAARPAPSPGLQGEPPPRGTGGSQPPWGLFPGLLTRPGTHPCDRDPWGQCGGGRHEPPQGRQPSRAQPAESTGPSQGTPVPRSPPAPPAQPLRQLAAGPGSQPRPAQLSQDPPSPGDVPPGHHEAHCAGTMNEARLERAIPVNSTAV